VRIRRLRLVNFRRFADFEILLEPGLNLIVGSNESGKSTVVDAIATVLFCDAASKAQTVLGLERWGSTSAMRLELDFEHEGALERLTKDFGAGRGELTDLTQSTVVADKNRIDERIREVLGFATRDAFQSVAAVRQGELAVLEGRAGQSRRGELVPMIERKMTSASGAVDAAGVVARIEREIAAMRRGFDRPAKNAGRLRTLTDSETDLERRIDEAGRGWNELLRTRSGLEKERDELASAAEELGRIERTLEVEEKRRESGEGLDEVRKALTEKETQIARVRKLRSDLAAAWERIPRTAPEKEMPVVEAKAAVDESKRRIGVLAERAPRGEWQNAGRRSGAIAIVAGAAALALIFTPIFAPISPALRVWLIAAGAAAAVAAILLFRRTTRLWAFAHDVRREEAARERNEASLREVLAAVGAATWEAFEQTRAANDETQKEVARKTDFLSGIVGDVGPDRYEEDLLVESTALERRLKGFEEILEDTGGEATVLSATEIAALRTRGVELRETVARLSETVKRAEIRLEQSASGDSLPDLEARLEAVRGELDALAVRERILRLARDGIESALSSTKEEASSAIEPVVGRVFSTLTLGRYSEVTVGDDLSVSVARPVSVPVSTASAAGSVPAGSVPAGSGSAATPVTPAGSPALDAADLSVGTVDQLYLATRYALLMFLGGSDGSPFILDDVLVNCDPERRRAALELLREISRERQVIVLACEKHGADLADSVIELPPV